MERDTIIFSGASHTFGLGLEWELDPELNSEEYLQKGINLPISRPDIYQKYWRENRWATLVCNELGYTQYNVHDMENNEKIGIKIGGNAVETIWLLVRDEDKIQHLLSKTKYVILEVGLIRWYVDELHGGVEGYKYPSTIVEMINLINNPDSDIIIVSKVLDWLKDVDINVYMLEIFDKIKYLKQKYTEITFLILPWHVDLSKINKLDFPKKNIIPLMENYKQYSDVHQFLQTEKLHVWNKAKAFNGDYTYNKIEEHASIEGHRRIADMVVNHIKKLENNKFTKIFENNSEYYLIVKSCFKFV
jgi:hypothetical protein